MIEKLSPYWQNLKPREKVWVVLLFSLLVPFLLVQFFILPLMEGINNANNAGRVLQNKIEQFYSNRNKLIDLSSKNQPTANPLDGTINQLNNQLGIKDAPEIRKDPNSTYGQYWVVRYSNLRSDQAVQLVYLLENNQPIVIIDRLEISESVQNKNFVSVSFVLRTE